MKIYLSLVTLVKNKKEKTGVVALNRPPVLKGKGAKPKYIAPDIAGEFKIKMVTSGDEENVKTNSFYLHRAFHNLKLGGKPAEYKIISCVHLAEMGETVWDKKFEIVPEKLKEYEVQKEIKKEEYPSVVLENAPNTVVPLGVQYKFPPPKFSKK